MNPFSLSTIAGIILGMISLGEQSPCRLQENVKPVKSRTFIDWTKEEVVTVLDEKELSTCRCDIMNKLQKEIDEFKEEMKIIERYYGPKYHRTAHIKMLD